MGMSDMYGSKETRNDLLHQGNDILPLFGTTKKSRLEENIEATAIQLSKEELSMIDKNSSEGAFAGTRYAAPQMSMVVN